MTTTTHHTARRTTCPACPAAWIGSGIYTDTITMYVTCELPLTDGYELDDTTCGFEDDVDVNLDDLGLTGTQDCPTCHRTNDQSAQHDDDAEPDTWDDLD